MSSESFIEIPLEDNVEEIDMTISQDAIPLIVELLTKMYPEPIEGTVREVISNAIDGTNLLPKADRKPIRVSLPTTFSPFFIVTDCGVGMSFETLKGNFLAYGSSKKKLDPKAIGKYGLGAKAPLAYTSEFIVETTHKGVTTKIIVSRSYEKSKSRVVFSENIGREDGTTISIPVDSDDFEKFTSPVVNYAKMSPDNDIYVDDVLFSSSDSFVRLGSIILDKEKDLTGDLLLKIEDKIKFIKDYYTGLEAVIDGFLLSGWYYSTGKGYYNSNLDNSSLLLEIAPSLVNFDPSRSSIIKDRDFEQFYSEVQNQLTLMRYEMVRKLLKDMTDKELMDILKNLIEAGFNGSDDNKNLIKVDRYSHRETVVEYSDLKNSNGFNPIDFIFDGDESVYAVTHGDKHAFVQNYGYHVQGYKDIPNFTQSTDNSRISTTNEILVKNVSMNKKIGLYQTLFSLWMMPQHRYNSYKVIVLYNLNEKSIKTIGRLRKYVSKNTYFIYADGEIDEAALETLSVICPDISQSDLDKKIDELKEIEKVNKPKSVKTERFVEVYEVTTPRIMKMQDDGKEYTHDDFARSISNLRLVNRSIRKLEEIIDEGHYFIITKKSSHHELFSTVAGAINNGLRFDTDSKVYVYPEDIVRGSKLYAEDMKKLSEYDKVFSSSEWVGRSKAANEIAENNSVSAEYVDSVISEIPLKVFLHKVFMSHYTLRVYYKDNMSLISKFSSNDDVKTIISCVTDALTLSETEAYNTINFMKNSELVNFVSDEDDARVVDKANRFFKKLEELHSSDDADDSIYITALRLNREESKEYDISNVVLKGLVKILDSV